MLCALTECRSFGVFTLILFLTVVILAGFGKNPFFKFSEIVTYVSFGCQRMLLVTKFSTPRLWSHELLCMQCCIILYFALFVYRGTDLTAHKYVTLGPSSSSPTPLNSPGLSLVKNLPSEARPWV